MLHQCSFGVLTISPTDCGRQNIERSAHLAYVALSDKALFDRIGKLWKFRLEERAC
jgi:hypothetical protein